MVQKFLTGEVLYAAAVVLKTVHWGVITNFPPIGSTWSTNILLPKVKQKDSSNCVAFEKTLTQLNGQGEKNRNNHPW